MYEVLRSSGAKCTVRLLQLPAHCAPLERKTVVARESINIWLLWSQNKAQTKKLFGTALN